MKEKTLPSVRRKFRFGLLKSWLTFGKCRLLSEKEKKITPPYWTWIMKLQKIYINMKLIIFYQSISILRHRFRLPIYFLTEGAEAAEPNLAPKFFGPEPTKIGSVSPFASIKQT